MMKNKLLFSTITAAVMTATTLTTLLILLTSPHASYAADTGRYPANERGGGGNRGGEVDREGGDVDHGERADRGVGEARPVARARGVPDRERDRPVVDHDGHVAVDRNRREVHAPVIQDPRPAHDVRHDPRGRTIRYRDVRVAGHWNAYYPTHGWIAAWHEGPNFAWDRVRSVTCEAVNVVSDELYPTSGLTSEGWDWSDNAVNQLLGESLDDCDSDPDGARDGNGGITCVPASPACTPTN